MEDGKTNFFIYLSSFIPEEVKTLFAIVLTWFYGLIGDNPIGFLASLFGLLYAFERYRAQRTDRILKERKLKNKTDDTE